MQIGSPKHFIFYKKKLYVVFKILTLFSKKPEYLSTYVVGRNLTDLKMTPFNEPPNPQLQPIWVHF
jgi:hypothetical protein